MVIFVVCACALAACGAPSPPPPTGHRPGANARTQALVAEARRRGLDQGDLIIERRLVQKLEWAVELDVSVPDPTDAQLQAYLAANGERYRAPATHTFEQHFFDRSLRSNAREDAATALGVLNDGGAVAADPWTRGHTRGATQSQVEGAFGNGAHRAIAASPVGQWSGPIQSPYGSHLIRVQSRSPAGTPEFSALRPRLAEDWEREQKRIATQARLDEIANGSSPGD